MARQYTAMEHATPSALETYLKQHPKADRKNHTVKNKAEPNVQAKPADKAQSKAPAKPAAASSLAGIFKPDDKVLSAAIQAHKATFDKVDVEADNAIGTFKPSTGVAVGAADHMAEIWPTLSRAEKRIHVNGHKIGEQFEKGLSKNDKELHERYMHEWRSSSTSRDLKGYDHLEDYVHESQELHGLAASLGVKGSLSPQDKVTDKRTQGGVTKARAAATKNMALRSYVRKMYEYQQAYFRNAGIKEVTLYRGVKDHGVQKAQDGTKLKIESRELSSFSADPNIAKRFGRVVKFKVPVERVFASALVRPAIGSETYEWSSKEAEFVIMGASDLEGETTMGKKRADSSKTASEVLHVPISDDNENWLQLGRAKAKSKSAALRVVVRWLGATNGGV